MRPEWADEIEKLHVSIIKKISPWSEEDMRFLALALAGEAGEFANKIKKHWRGDPIRHPMWDPAVRKELVDVRVYLHLLTKTLGIIDIDRAVEERLPYIREKATKAKEETK